MVYHMGWLDNWCKGRVLFGYCWYLINQSYYNLHPQIWMKLEEMLMNMIFLKRNCCKKESSQRRKNKGDVWSFRKEIFVALLLDGLSLLWLWECKHSGEEHFKRYGKPLRSKNNSKSKAMQQKETLRKAQRGAIKSIFISLIPVNGLWMSV